MSAEENKKHIIHNAKVKCVLCGKVGFSSDKKGLARHLRLAHNKNNVDNYFIEVAGDVPIDIIPKDKIAFKKMVNKLLYKERKEKNTHTGTNNSKPKRTKAKRKSIYWGAVIKTAFESKR
ncbi:MAG: hypothetical protein IKQ12_08595 [Prevotella sp.]|nr:hypothetical protein [Prevotella sp.]